MLSREITHSSFQWQHRRHFRPKRAKRPLPSRSEIDRMIAEAKANGRYEICPPAWAEGGRLTSYEGIL